MSQPLPPTRIKAKRPIRQYTLVAIKDDECHVTMRRVRSYRNFKWAGHRFCVTPAQPTLFAGRFVVSHATLGFRIPGDYYKTVAEAVKGARAQMDREGLATVAKSIETARSSLGLLIPARRGK